MNNEQYQENLEKSSKNKRDNHGHQYFGDKVSTIIFKLTKKFIQEPILDVGAGTGALITTIKKHKYPNIKGIDLYPKADFIIKGLITALPFQTNEFKTIFCTEVIEHLTNEQITQGLNEIFRVLQTNGTLIITVPFDEILEKNSFTCPNCNHRFHHVGHLQSFSEQRIITILKNHGFRILKIKTYALGAMAKLPLGIYFNWLFKKINYEFIGKSLMIICKK